MTELEKRFMQYHRDIDRAFLRGATPFQITKVVWRLHAEMSRYLAVHAAQLVVAVDSAEPSDVESHVASDRAATEF